MSKKNAAFTLIELLTVIAIIGILAAILIPVVGRVREQARFSSCISNLRQWGAANLLHANDHNGLIPWDGQVGGTPSASNLEVHMGTLPWFNALPRYMDSLTIAELAAANDLPKLGDQSVFVCPSAQKTSPAPDWLCYGPNYLLSLRSLTSDSATRVAITRLDRIRDPSRVPLFAETTNHAPGSTGAFSNANPNHLRNHIRHAGRAPVVFFDGHVQSFTPEELNFQGIAANNINAPVPIRWNPLHQ